MKIGIFGDLHVTDMRPRNRTDKNYLETISEKITWSCLNPLKYCKYVMFPGDVFDSFRANDFLKQYFVPILRTIIEDPDNCIKMFLAIYGQHDLRFHNSNRLNTPLRVVETSNVVELLGKEPFVAEFATDIYGMNWGEEIPKIENPDNLNILVAHMMVIKDDKLWEKQEGHTMARVLLRKTGFDLIITGDNHQFFTDALGDRYLLNMGSLMRSKIDQIHHTPSVAVYDTEDKSFHVEEIPVKPYEEVFRVEEALQEKEKSENLEAFIEKLEQTDTENIEGLDFRKNLYQWVEENKDTEEQGVLDIIEEATNPEGK